MALKSGVWARRVPDCRSRAQAGVMSGDQGITFFLEHLELSRLLLPSRVPSSCLPAVANPMSGGLSGTRGGAAVCVASGDHGSPSGALASRFGDVGDNSCSGCQRRRGRAARHPLLDSHGSSGSQTPAWGRSRYQDKRTARWRLFEGRPSSAATMVGFWPTRLVQVLVGVDKPCATRTKPLARRPTGSRVVRSGVGSVAGGAAYDRATRTHARRTRPAELCRDDDPNLPARPQPVSRSTSGPSTRSTRAA